MRYSKQHSALFWHCEMSERIINARTVTEAAASPYGGREGLRSQRRSRVKCRKLNRYAPLAQLDRALVYGTKG